MEVAAGLTLVKILVEKLGSPIWTKIESMWGLESELEKLKDSISTIQAVLLDADEEDIHQQQHRSHVVRNRLQRLRDALYRADDLFDEIATLAHREKLLSSNKVSRELCLFFCCSNQLRSSYNWSGELEKIREMLDDIVKDHRFDFGQRHPVALEPWRMMKMRHHPRETHSYCEESDIIGREDDKKKVIDMLLGSTSVEKNVSVISIVGIGGLGKTSLAQLVYNDATIKTEFPLRMWVCVSDDFNVGALLYQIIATATHDKKEELDMLSMNKLQSSLERVINGKKYLLVLDDIWNEDPLKWHELSVLLEKGGSGSRIIVTTRSKRVVDVAQSSKVLQLGGLSEDDSRKLFRRIAFEGENNQQEEIIAIEWSKKNKKIIAIDGEKNQHEDNLVEIEKEILSKCRNVPLAIRVVGSLLRGQDTRTWEYIKNTDLVNIEQDDNGILPVLKISYYHLPFYLKSCFSYCAVFPKDYRFMKDDLIRLWMAQGFVTPLDGQSLEEAGDKYFNHLLQRCFFQDVEKDSNGGIISCKMHDLIHDVAKEVAGTEILSSNNRESDFNERARHFFIDNSIERRGFTFTDSFKKMKRMRSLFCYDFPAPTGYSYLRSIMNMLLSEVRYLRVLDLHGMELLRVPSVIGELMHLRYLDLSNNYHLYMLPESITELYNLQTLNLRDCLSLETLPTDLCKLANLRDLDIFGCKGLKYMPPGMNKMTSLQKLTKIVISGTINTSPRCVDVLEDLKNFTNRAYSLEICFGKFVRHEDKLWRNLLNKQQLRKIKIDWNTVKDDNNIVRNTSSDVLLQDLESYHNLSNIYLQGDRKRTEPPVEHLPWLNHLRHLKVLVLSSLRNLKYVEGSVISESRNTLDSLFFPSLEELRLEELPQLKGWRETTSESDSYSFPRLTFLEISGCPELKTIPWCPNLEKLDLRNFNIELNPNKRWGSDTEQGRLKEVTIDKVGYLNSMPAKSFHRHSELTISKDITIESLTREVCLPVPSLRSLIIYGCKKFERLSGQGYWEHCTALETLKLNSLVVLELEDEDEGNINNRDGDEGEIRKEVTVTPWRFLSHSLRRLILDGLPKLEKLPNGMRHLTSLQSIFIRSCTNFKFMSGLMGVPSLQSLEIYNSNNLVSMSDQEMHGLASLKSLYIFKCDNLKSMSNAMRQLTSLQQLTLENNSAELNKRCKPNGADWPNIQHIPKIEIKVRNEEQDSTVTYEN